MNNLILVDELISMIDNSTKTMSFVTLTGETANDRSMVKSIDIKYICPQLLIQQLNKMINYE